MRFSYGAKDVCLHSYPDEETLSMQHYLTFQIDDKVKHMRVIYRDYEFEDELDISETILNQNDGVMVWTPTEIVMFPTKKVIDEIEIYRDMFGYNEGYIPLAIVSGYLTRTKIESNG